MGFPKPISLPWARPIPPFRPRLEGEDWVVYHEAEGLFMHNACVQQKAEHLLAHPEDLRLNRSATRVTSVSEPYPVGHRSSNDEAQAGLTF